MKYDVTLKSLFHELPDMLVKLLTGSAVKQILTVEYPSVKKRLPDFVVRLENGAIYHLELQSDTDESMSWRMLEYYWLIHDLYGQAPIQQVLYVGESSQAHFKTKIQKDTLQFEYQLIDIRDIDCRLLLQSPCLADNLLAVLCRIDDKLTVVQQILYKITQLDYNARQDAIEKLLVLIGLRKRSQLADLLKQEVNNMPATLYLDDLKEIPLFKELFDKVELQGEQRGEQRGELRGEKRGIQLGELKILLRQINKRFGEIPHWAQMRLQEASVEQLESWSDKLLEVDRLEDLFTE